MSIEEAVDKAVDYAIANNYLDGFFKKHKESIMNSCLTEFNEEVFRKGIHEEGYNEGFSDAMITLIHNLQNSDTKETVIAQLMKCFSLSNSDAINLVNEHWK